MQRLQLRAQGRTGTHLFGAAGVLEQQVGRPANVDFPVVGKTDGHLVTLFANFKVLAADRLDVIDGGIVGCDMG